MNENIDLTKILKDCPKGWKFYSSIYGEVEFIEVLSTPSIQRMIHEELWFLPESKLRDYPIQFKVQDVIYRVTSGGTHIKGMGECTFFPSKDQRDWNKFKAPWLKKPKFDPKTLHPFDKVLIRSTSDCKWSCSLFSHINDKLEYNNVCNGFNWKYCIPYNKETEHLVGTSEEAPEYYRYWED